jgi:hypothetical protein
MDASLVCGIPKKKFNISIKSTNVPYAKLKNRSLRKTWSRRVILVRERVKTKENSKRVQGRSSLNFPFLRGSGFM